MESFLDVKTATRMSVFSAGRMEAVAYEAASVSSKPLVRARNAMPPDENVVVPVPASQDAVVVAFVHLFLNSQLPLPKSKYEPTAERSTSPVMVPVDVLVAQLMLPPDMMSELATVKLPPFVVQSNCMLLVVRAMLPLTANVLPFSAILLAESLKPLSV